MRTTLSKLTSELSLVEGLERLLRRTALRVTLLQLLAGLTLFAAGAALGMSAQAQTVTVSLEEAIHWEVMQELRVNVEQLYQQNKVAVSRSAQREAAYEQRRQERAKLARNTGLPSTLQAN